MEHKHIINRIKKNTKNKSSKEKKSFLLRMLGENHPIIRYLSEMDRTALKWCGIIIVILLGVSLLSQVNIHREKGAQLIVSTNNEWMEARLSAESGYQNIPQYILTAEPVNHFHSVDVITNSIYDGHLFGCTLYRDQVQYFTTTNEPHRENMLVRFHDVESGTKIPLGSSSTLGLGIDKRRITAGQSGAQTGVLDLYYIRGRNLYNLPSDTVVMNITIVSEDGTVLFGNDTFLTMDSVLASKQADGSLPTLAETVEKTDYLGYLAETVTGNPELLSVLATTAPENQPLTLNNTLIMGGDGQCRVNSDRKKELDKAIVDFIEKVQTFETTSLRN